MIPTEQQPRHRNRVGCPIAWRFAVAFALLLGTAPYAQAQRTRKPRSRSTASRCSTWASTSRPSTRTGPTRCASPAAVVRRSVRQGRQHVRRRAPEPAGRAEASRPRRSASCGPRSSSKCSAPASTRARRRSACAMPMASSASSARASTWSPFMDIDVFPNSLEYWGPTGMVFFRNVQVRWMPIQGDTRLDARARAPGRIGDAGVLADRIELQNVKGRSPMPDFTGEYRLGGSRGYFEVAGIARPDEVGRPARRPVRPVGQRDALGHQLQLERQARLEHHAARCSWSTAKASRTT